MKSNGYQTNSSTFGTLLSSQGSSAHLSSASRPAGGQPGKTYRSRSAESNRRLLLQLPGVTMPPSRPEAVKARTQVTSDEAISWGSRFGAGRPASRPCVPPLRGDRENIRRLPRGRQIGSVWRGPHRVLSQVRGGFGANSGPAVSSFGSSGSGANDDAVIQLRSTVKALASSRSAHPASRNDSSSSSDSAANIARTPSSPAAARA